ncbi:4-dihydromethyltrisporate dehydrogenase [Syncephalastrum racemosum]|uniref:4-dihydromethyltrisporate dehydrogenase n=1 Tax=Syncephalastrum racemosum TaxID=13706 RepID=A0A1X2HI03_SYNRA|nr:4-dihydromethyltrisporate dehydrogenase [Syncephalastrum racemosum]
MTTDYVTLDRTGDKMPMVGFGTWKVTDADAEDTIYNAIKAGYRLIDTAAVYDNETGVGRGIRKAISEGIIKREDIFVVTKLWNSYHNKKHVRPMLEKQLSMLGLDYVDLYHIHWPIPMKFIDPAKCYPPGWIDPETKRMDYEPSPMQDCYRALEELVDAGLIRNIGISNFNVQLILDVLTYAKYKPAVLQIELHPYLQQSRLVEWTQKQGIHVTAYSSFGPAAFDNFTSRSSTVGPLLEHDTIKAIANKHGKSTGQVLLRWSIERKVAVIPKSSNEGRMKSNLDLFSWSLDEEDRKSITDMNQNIRFNDLQDVMYGFELPLFD